MKTFQVKPNLESIQVFLNPGLLGLRLIVTKRIRVKQKILESNLKTPSNRVKQGQMELEKTSSSSKATESKPRENSTSDKKTSVKGKKIEYLCTLAFTTEMKIFTIVLYR